MRSQWADLFAGIFWPIITAIAFGIWQDSVAAGLFAYGVVFCLGNIL
jgi:hypothetical protein